MTILLDEALNFLVKVVEEKTPEAKVAYKEKVKNIKKQIPNCILYLYWH